MTTSNSRGHLRKVVNPTADAVIICVEATAVVEELCRRQNASPPAMLHLGKAALSSFLLQALSDLDDDPERIHLYWKVDGVFGELIAEAHELGVMRARLSSPTPSVHDLEVSLGNGSFEVTRWKGGQPTRGVIDSGGDVHKDFQSYLENSEQKLCAVSFSVKVNYRQNPDSGENEFFIEKALAYLIHFLPQIKEGDQKLKASEWDRYMQGLGPLSQWKLSDDSETATLEMAKYLLARPDVNSVKDYAISYGCRCSFERAKSVIAMLTPEEQEDSKNQREDRKIEVSCEFCGQNYLVD